MTILPCSGQFMQKKVTGHGNRSNQYTSKSSCQLVLALLFNRGSAMLHKPSSGMLQYSLLTLNIQTLDALERNHLYPNTLIGRAEPIIVAPTQHIECDNSSKGLGGPSKNQIWFFRRRMETSERCICGV